MPITQHHHKARSIRAPKEKQPKKNTRDGSTTQAGLSKSWSFWTPPAMSARLRVEDALSTLPRRTRGIYAEASSTLTRIVGEVDRRLLAPETATEQLRQLAGRLLLHRQAADTTCDARDRAAIHPPSSFLP